MLFYRKLATMRGGPSTAVRKYLSEIGIRGGRRSKRQLNPEQARKMVQIREAKRAYRRFHAKCFWSYDPDYRIGYGDVDWVAQELAKHGDREAWLVAARLRKERTR